MRISLIHEIHLILEALVMIEVRPLIVMKERILVGITETGIETGIGVAMNPIVMIEIEEIGKSRHIEEIGKNLLIEEIETSRHIVMIGEIRKSIHITHERNAILQDTRGNQRGIIHVFVNKHDYNANC